MVKKILGIIILLVGAVAAPFYLFVVPMMVATGSLENDVPSLLFGAFMTFQLFLVVFIYTWEAMSPVYGLPRTIFFRSFKRNKSKGTQDDASHLYTGALIMLSYPMLIYAFAVLYVFVSRLDPTSFSSCLGLNGFDAFYFSLITATTVGYGDIAPTSVLAKSITMVQIFLSLGYAVLVFSALSSFFQHRSK
jgi:hypothetical protein